MQSEERFNHLFWNDKFLQLNAHNSTMPDVAEEPEDFMNRLDEIAIEKEIASFGMEEHFSSVRATMDVDCGAGNKFQIDINAEKRFNKNTRVKITYVELSKVHENSKEFLTNIFFQRLPYVELEMLLDSLNNFDEEYNSALLEFRKCQKLTQINIATIKSLLSEKFKNTKYQWIISDFGTAENLNFLIKLMDNEEEISSLVVDRTNLIQKILEWKI